MNKKTYHHPAIEVMSVEEREPLLAGSGKATGQSMEIDLEDAGIYDVGQAPDYLDF